MNPDTPPPALMILVPDDWSDEAVLTFGDCYRILHGPQRTARDWMRRRVGPRWGNLEGTSGLYVTVAELRRFIHTTIPGAHQ